MRGEGSVANVVIQGHARIVAAAKPPSWPFSDMKMGFWPRADGRFTFEETAIFVMIGRFQRPQ
jgi:hypothetical protein